jgi:hypothetical protein
MNGIPLSTGQRIGILAARCMRALLWAVLGSSIVTIQASAADDRPADAVTVYHCTFGEEFDVNFDNWPDEWVRKTGLQYPHYVKIAIQEDADTPAKRHLQFDLDGAAAAVSSPPIRVLSRFSYVFEVLLKTENLKHTEVVITLDFCDSQGRVLVSESSPQISITKDWQKIQLGPLEPGDSKVEFVVINLTAARGSRGDLHGRVSVADVWLKRLPRIAVSTENPCNVYTELDEVVVHCELSGIRERDPEIRFQLFDAFNRERDAANFKLNGRMIVDDQPQSSELKAVSGEAPNGYEGTEKWQPKIPDYGFYRVDVKMLSSDLALGEGDTQRQLGNDQVWLVVVPPLPMPKQGEFGWTLPNADKPLGFQDLSRLLPLVGINWVKLPVWFDANDSRRGDELIRFVELLGASNIETVGIIDQPPTMPKQVGDAEREIPVAELLLDTASPWLASLDPVMTRLSLRVRWWQLGRDGDTSFASVAELVKKLAELRTLLFRFGQDVSLGINWDWESGNEVTGKVSWEFEQLCNKEQLSEQKFDEILSTPRNNSALHWILIEPPPWPKDVSPYDEATQAARASEFVRRLVTAKVRGASQIMVSNPFQDHHGLMDFRGMPGELLLPWRTTAAMLSGAKYLGQMRLPAGSDNHIFHRPDGQLVMVAWNPEPAREVLYLGENIKTFDLEGRPIAVTSQRDVDDNKSNAILELGPTPVFVLGLHEAITRWRMAMVFEHVQVPSINTVPHANSLKLKNFFPQGVGGSLRIVVRQDHALDDSSGNETQPKESANFVSGRWTIEPEKGTFALAAGEETTFPFEVRLKNAFFGNQPIRVDFSNVQADETYNFSVYTELEVGTGDLSLDVNTHINEDGALIVEQLMTNRAEHLADFRCKLYAKAGKPLRMQVYRLGANVDRKIYRIPNGKELVGRRMLLDIEEMNGKRVLKYRFVATAESKAVDANTTDASVPARGNIDAVNRQQPKTNLDG